MHTVHIQLRALTALSMLADSTKDKSNRKYLQGVCIELDGNGGFVATATDGKALGMYGPMESDERSDGPVGYFIISTATIADLAAVKMPRYYSNIVRLENHGAEWRAVIGSTSMLFVPLDENFPDYRYILREVVRQARSSSSEAFLRRQNPQ